MRAIAARGSPWLPVHSSSVSLAVEVAELVLVEIAEALRQVAGLHRHLDDAMQGAAGDDQLAAGGVRGIGHGADAGDVGGERRHRDAPLGALDDLGDRGGDVDLGRRAAVAEGIGRIADERVDALARRCAASRASSGGSPTSGAASSFQSPVWKTRPSGVSISSADGSGIECASVDQLDVERPDLEAALHRHLGDRQLQRAAELGELGLQHAGGERRRVDRRLQPRPQVDDGADVVLVRVRQHDAGESSPFAPR